MPCGGVPPCFSFVLCFARMLLSSKLGTYTTVKATSLPDKRGSETTFVKQLLIVFHKCSFGFLGAPDGRSWTPVKRVLPHPPKLVGLPDEGAVPGDHRLSGNNSHLGIAGVTLHSPRPV